MARLFEVDVSVTEIKKERVFADTQEEAKRLFKKMGFKIAPLSVPVDITDRERIRYRTRRVDHAIHSDTYEMDDEFP